MKTLYDRLVWIWSDLNPGMGEARPKDIEKLLKLSSGRPTQIKAKGEAARLGAEKLAILTELGYSADWVQIGKGEPRASDAPPVSPGMSEQEKIKHIQAAVASMVAAAGLKPGSVTVVCAEVGSEEYHSEIEKKFDADASVMNENRRRHIIPTGGFGAVEPRPSSEQKKTPGGKPGGGQ